MFAALALVLLALPLACLVYAYLVYPLLLQLLVGRRPGVEPDDPIDWPLVTVLLPVYNEARVIEDTVRSLLAIDYPADRRQILVISDCSTDGTDDIVRRFQSQGVALVRLEQRGGKTAAENAARPHVKGSIVVNTDATTRIAPKSLRLLVRAFGDPAIGVASGHDVSVGPDGPVSRDGEAGYVGYEMWLRSLETRFGGIVGASGCFFGIRRDLFNTLVPEALSRDFASPLIAREYGYRAVSVDAALCFVPRALSLRAEFRRKVRTMARGLETLWFKRALMNPLHHGRFAFMLISHKLVRWLVFLLWPAGVLGLIMVALEHGVAWLAVGLGAGAVMVGGWAVWRDGVAPGAVPAVPRLLGFLLVTQVAGFLAWIKALRGERNPMWEPTRRV